MDDIVGQISIVILILVTAFFVVSEFAIVKVPESRLDSLIKEGNKKAIYAKRILSNIESYLFACQIGITVSAVALGWIGDSVISTPIAKLFSNIQVSDSLTTGLSVGAAFFLVTFLQLVFGEILPKMWSVQKAEQALLLFSKPLTISYKILYPFIWLFYGSAKGIAKLFGIKPLSKQDNVHTEEELRYLLSESFKSGEINQSEYRYVNNIFDFDERIAKEIMTPRREMVSLDINDSLEDFLNVIRNERFTRYPVYDGDTDHIIGLVNIKELLTAAVSQKDLAKLSIRSFIRPIIRTVDTLPIGELLVKMQKEQIHMAILMDEYGGTSGLVTVEDIVEEIVGEIRDEFDIDEVPDVQHVGENHYIFDSKILISDVNKLLSLEIDDEAIDTLGGWILTEKFDAKQGDIIEYEGYQFKILEMEDFHIETIEVKALEKQAETIYLPNQNSTGKPYSDPAEHMNASV